MLGAKYQGHKGRLPIMAVNHVRKPHALDAFDGGARKFREALGVVRIVAGFISIELRTVEERRVVHKKIANAADRLALQDRGKAQSIAQRNGDARNQN